MSPNRPQVEVQGVHVLDLASIGSLQHPKLTHGKKLRTVEELSGKARHGGTMMDYAIGSPVNFFLFGFRRQILSTSYLDHISFV